MVKEKIIQVLKKYFSSFITQEKDFEINLDIPNNQIFGDYTTTLPLKIAKSIKKNPLIIAEKIKKELEKIEDLEKIEVVKPGFVNIWISKNYLIKKLHQISNNQFDFPAFHFGKEKKIMVEFAHPNTHKLFHIGHLRNISLGESLVRIYQTLKNQVIRANYQGDVGLHIAKCLWGVKKNIDKIKKLKTIKEKIDFIGKMYTLGTRFYEDDEKAKNEIIEINKMIYNQDKEIFLLWQETRKWSLEYFEKTYKRVGSYFDRLYFESEMTKKALSICQEALKRGILEKSQGAIVFNGKKYQLDTRVFINSLGFPTYEGKELALADKEFSDFGNLDKNIHVVTPEQTSFFKVTFKVQELLDEKKYKGKQYHLAYEWVKLKEGKMSSREGNIIEANWLIDKVKEKILSQFNCDEKTAETLAISCVKYSFLKNSPKTPFYFDIDESVTINGNSGSYLTYTYVRCQSVLKKSQNLDLELPIAKSNENIEEVNLIRKINQFPDIVLKAGIHYSPNLIATYLYELASQYNLFYQNNPIIKSQKKTRNLRLLITSSTKNVIKKGLELLGIKTVEKM